MEQVRQIVYFKHYFSDFFNKQTESVKEKIDYVLFVLTVAERIPKKFFEHMTGTDGLYEIRVDRGIFIEFSLVLTKGAWLFYSMVFRKKHKGHHEKKLTRL